MEGNKINGIPAEGEKTSVRGTYDKTIFYNPANKYCIISVKSADTGIPARARSTARYRDHLIRFTAVGFELPRTDAVEVTLEGEWTENSRYGWQLQVEQWSEIIPPTEEGITGYLGSGLIKGIGEKTAADIVLRFGLDALDILEHHPEKLLEIRGITENKLEDIKASFAESRMLRNLMTLLAPFKLTPKTAQKVYEFFGPSSVEILRKSPFELCRISGFGFKRVDAIVQKTGGNLHDPVRVHGAVYCTLGDARGKKGHLYLGREELVRQSLRLLNENIPIPQLKLKREEVEAALQDMILKGRVVLQKEDIYQTASFAQEDEAARRIAERLSDKPPMLDVTPALASVKGDLGLELFERQEEAVVKAFHYNFSIITGPPGTGKTTVLKTILNVYRRVYKNRKIMLMAPTGRASRRMAESTGFEEAKTMHSSLGLSGEEDGDGQKKKETALDADLIIVDEFSMVDMWLAWQFFTHTRKDTKVVLVGDPDQLPSVGPGSVFRELIQCGLVPVTVLDKIARQSKDSLIPYNARLINSGNTNLYYGNDFIFIPVESQEEAAGILVEYYYKEIGENGIEKVQILSPFRESGEASACQLNAELRELVNPYQSEENEITFGSVHFRVGDRVMQNKNTEKVSNGDLGFIRYIKETPEGRRIGMDFGAGRELEYSMEDMANLELAYATTIHKAMGSEYEIILLPVLEAHLIMLYRNLIYTGITRAKKRVIMVGQKKALYAAIHRGGNDKRNTRLGEKIQLYYKAFSRNAGIQAKEPPDKKLKDVS